MAQAHSFKSLIFGENSVTQATHQGLQKTTENFSDWIEKTNLLAEQLLSWAEGLFGPRVGTWNYVGVEVNDHPPHLVYYPEEGQFSISLSCKAIDDQFQCVFQLAHEVCHSLYPSADRNTGQIPATTILNEGVSTYFSVLAVAKLFGEEASSVALASLSDHSPGYFNALNLVSQLLEKDTARIRKLREIQPMLNDLLARDFERAAVGVEGSAIEILLSDFKNQCDSGAEISINK